MADYYMNQRISKQSRAFTVGFKEVIPDRWLRIFSTPAQLQRLVGGDENAALDLEDLKKYVIYEGGYHSRHKVIKNLWQVIEELEPHEQGLFVKFVTSVSKPPLLGFEFLKPPMTIRFVPVDASEKEEVGIPRATFLSSELPFGFFLCFCVFSLSIVLIMDLDRRVSLSSTSSWARRRKPVRVRC